MIQKEQILARFEKVYASTSDNSQYQCLCPNHNDKTASLGIKFDGDKVVINCFGGCETGDVIQAAGLNWSDIMPDSVDIDNYFASRDNEEHFKVKKPSNYVEDVQNYFKNDMYGGISLPFDFTDDKFKIRLGETSIITGYSGHGKTAWLSYIVLKLLNENKSLIASFEMLPKATLGRMLLQNGTTDPTDNAIKSFVQGLDEKLYLYDAEGETSVEKIISVIFYSAEKLGVKVVIIDSLMKCGINEDDYNKQKKFVNQLCVASRDLNIKIFLVCHSRKTFNEHGEPSKFDVLGSSNITNLADNCITVFRNKAKEEILNAESHDKKEEAKQ